MEEEVAEVAATPYSEIMILHDILANAERLISDAHCLCDAGRHRSAATLVVVALEHFGFFVEELTQEKYPGGVAYMGMFGNKNAHARRQDALATHVMNFAQGQALLAITFEAFFLKTGCGDPGKYMQWLKQAAPISFTDEQKQRMRSDPDIGTANLLMKAVRQNYLKMLREYGLYENVEMKFPDATVIEVIELAEKVRAILEKSQDCVTPEPMQVAGINMPEGQILPYTKESQIIPSASEVFAQLDGQSNLDKAARPAISPLFSGQF